MHPSEPPLPLHTQAVTSTSPSRLPPPFFLSTTNTHACVPPPVLILCAHTHLRALSSPPAIFVDKRHQRIHIPNNTGTDLCCSVHTKGAEVAGAGYRPKMEICWESACRTSASQQIKGQQAERSEKQDTTGYGIKAPIAWVAGKELTMCE